MAQVQPGQLPLGHSHGVELGLLWVGCHSGRCPFHNTQLGPRLVRRGPLRFWGHQVRCRSPSVALGRMLRAGGSTSGVGSPTFMPKMHVQALEQFNTECWPLPRSPRIFGALLFGMSWQRTGRLRTAGMSTHFCSCIGWDYVGLHPPFSQVPAIWFRAMPGRRF